MAFSPTRPQMRAKARFWQAAQDNPLVDVTCLSLAEIERMSDCRSIAAWSKEHEDFYRWFTSPDEMKVLIREGVEAGVARLVKIVQEDRVGPREPVTTSNQLAAIKLLMEVSGMLANKSEVTVKTQQQLPEDEHDLKKYIAAGVEKLKLAEKT